MIRVSAPGPVTTMPTLNAQWQPKKSLPRSDVSRTLSFGPAKLQPKKLLTCASLPWSTTPPKLLPPPNLQLVIMQLSASEPSDVIPVSSRPMPPPADNAPPEPCGLISTFCMSIVQVA